MKRYVNATLSKRFGAFLLDIFTIVITATILYSLFGQIIVRTKAFSEGTRIMNEILVDSNLYVYDEENKNLVEIVPEDEYAEAIEKYYIEYKEDAESYHNKMNESGLFDYIDGEYVKKENKEDAEVTEFYNNLMTNAIIEVKNSENYLFCYQNNMNFVYYNMFLSIILSYFIYIILIPIVIKRRTTIGQKVMNLSLINSESNNFASKTQVIFRAFIILISEVVLSIFSYGLPIIISIGFIIFRKDKCSYHDLLSNIKMIDYHYVEIDDNRKNGNN